MAGRLISIYRTDVFDCFRTGEPGKGVSQPIAAEVFFRTSIATQYDLFAKRFGCRLKLSAFRLEDARRLWIRDADRIEMEPTGVLDAATQASAEDADGIPNHFKQVGFLTYWLRRRCVVESSERDLLGRSPAQKTPQDRFILNANEICAFLIGFRMCQYFEMASPIEADDDIVGRIRRIDLQPHFVYDAATLLRHKSLSPHALYLIYRSLFYRLDWSQYEDRP